MLEKERQKAKGEIQKNIAEFSGETRWKRTPHASVIKLGTKFCNELIDLTETLDQENKINHVSLFSNVVVVLVAQTSAYEGISKEELEAFEKLFDELRVLRDEFLKNGLTDYMFDKIMYIRELFLTNTVCREDFDCKYRQGMPFPNFIDLYEIVHKINANWDSLVENKDFKRKRVDFFELRHFDNTDTGKERKFAREFLNMLDEILK